jgi:phosphoadenosine phosphosulfate reductase
MAASPRFTGGCSNAIRKVQPVTDLVAPVPIERSAGAPGLPAAADLDEMLRHATPAEVFEAALKIVGRQRLALVSSFGTESAALLKVMADVDAAIPVIFLDTGWLFEETLAYRDTLIATLNLKDVRSIKPNEETLRREDSNRELWFSDPDACCRIRKVEPLKRALAPFDAWINGRKRFQGGVRAAIPVVEEDGTRLKFNPFANVSREEIAAIYKEAKLPPHPLLSSGFLSVGCMPCTSRSSPDEDARAGRWRGRAKTECGIHTVNVS